MGTLCFAVAVGITLSVGVRSRSQIEGVVVRDLAWSERDRVVAYALRISNRTTDEMAVTINLVAVHATAEQREARPDLGRVQLALVLGPAEEKTCFRWSIRDRAGSRYSSTACDTNSVLWPARIGRRGHAVPPE